MKEWIIISLQRGINHADVPLYSLTEHRNYTTLRLETLDSESFTSDREHKTLQDTNLMKTSSDSRGRNNKVYLLLRKWILFRAF